MRPVQIYSERREKEAEPTRILNKILFMMRTKILVNKIV
jgi:hypothetical protein